jgi:hypothetical protein
LESLTSIERGSQVPLPADDPAVDASKLTVAAEDLVDCLTNPVTVGHDAGGDADLASTTGHTHYNEGARPISTRMCGK